MTRICSTLLCFTLFLTLVAARRGNCYSYRGAATTFFYIWQTESEDGDSSSTELLLSEELRFDYERLPIEGLSFHTYLRALKHFAPEDSAGFEKIFKVHNLYAVYSPARWADIRVGRQFLSYGVSRGSMDGATVRLTVPGIGRIVGIAGTAVSTESLSVQPIDGNLVWGGQIASDYLPNSDISASYFTSNRNDTTSRQTAGIDARFRPLPGVRPFLGMTYDFVGSRVNKWYVGCAARGFNDLSGYLGYTYLEPTFSDNSFFATLSSRGRSRIRLSATYSPDWIASFTAVYVNSLYETETSHYVEVSADASRASIGIGHSLGFGGERTAAFVTGNYDPLFWLLLTGGIEYARYGVATLDEPSEREDDLVAHVGADVRLSKDVGIHTRVEYLINDEYIYDVRFLSLLSLGFGR